jgi:hypothetical protein
MELKTQSHSAKTLYCMYVASICWVIARQYNKTMHCMYVASICHVLPRQLLYCMNVA